MMFRFAIAVGALLVTVATAHAQCPKVGSARQQFALAEGFTPDPNRRIVTAGGNLDLGRCSGVPGKGWVTELPDFIVRYATNSGGRARVTLTFSTESGIDTVLLVNDPSQRWHFNDDGGSGLNARIRFPKALNGRYDIWVGTFKRGQFTKVNLVITEID